MSKNFEILKFVGKYKYNIIYYFLAIVLSTVFSLISFGLFQPFLQIIFNENSTLTNQTINQGATQLGFLGAIGYDIKFFFYNILFKSGNKTTALGYICVFILIGVFLRNIFVYLSYYFLIPIRAEISRKFSRILYEKIIHFPLSYFTRQKKGDILSRSTNDIVELEYSIHGILEGIIKEPITIIGILICLFLLSLKLTLFVLIFFPLAGLIIGLIGKSLKKNNLEAQAKLSSVLTHLEESITGIRVIKSFNAEKKLTAIYNKLIDEIFNIKVKIAYKRDSASPVSEFLGVSVICIVLWFGGNLVLHGNVLTPSEFLTYIIYFSLIINPIKALTASIYNIHKGRAALERLDYIQKEVVEDTDNPSGVQLQEFKTSIEFKNVSFSYVDKEVLHQLNFEIKKGESVALVGMSGSGKSTLSDLIPRFHTVTQGQILIDGIDINLFNLKSLRNQIGIVNQEPFLFNDSVAINISIGKDNATLEDIQQAATIANAHNFIMQKEHQYNTSIGDRGLKLSGGEKQRLTIARAILKNPAILILDEATSSLDSESEQLVQQSINSVMKNRTSLIIAHRLSTIQNCDKIIVLNKGQIVEQGKHEDLVKKMGYYYKLLSTQFEIEN
ncbi:MAG: ABC transporter ATP-binding protein [Alphaproteobacteria bacterium]|nr:ABC transporter ATP-binding protein [Alphaproteobacteria bacterium]